MRGLCSEQSFTSSMILKEADQMWLWALWNEVRNMLPSGPPIMIFNLFGNNSFIADFICWAITFPLPTCKSPLAVFATLAAADFLSSLDTTTQAYICKFHLTSFPGPATGSEKRATWLRFRCRRCTVRMEWVKQVMLILIGRSRETFWWLELPLNQPSLSSDKFRKKKVSQYLGKFWLQGLKTMFIPYKAGRDFGVVASGS